MILTDGCCSYLSCVIYDIFSCDFFSAFRFTTITAVYCIKVMYQIDWYNKSYVYVFFVYLFVFCTCSRQKVLIVNVKDGVCNFSCNLQPVEIFYDANIDFSRCIKNLSFDIF